MVEAQVAHAVVAHPDRLEVADWLQASVEAEVYSIDWETRGERWNHQHALKRLISETDAEHLVLLEDDAILCPGYHEALDGFLSALTSPVASLYLGTGSWAMEAPATHAPRLQLLVERAERHGVPYVTADRLWHGVAVVLHRSVAEDVLDHMQRRPWPTDAAIGSWCRRNRIEVPHAHPSLVDHADGPSVTQHPDGRIDRGVRRAWRVMNQG
jgi:hypothetical protein